MALPPTLRTWTNAARLTQEPLDPRQGHGQRLKGTGPRRMRIRRAV